FMIGAAGRVLAAETARAQWSKGRRRCSAWCLAAVFTEWCRPSGALSSRMRDSGWDTIPPDVRFAGEPARREFRLGHHAQHPRQLTERPSCEAEHMAAPTSPAREENPCQPGANGMDPRPRWRWNLRTITSFRRHTMRIVRVGLDLAKYVFEVHAVDARG